MSVPKAPEGQFLLLYFASASSVTKKQYELFNAPLSVRELFTALEEQYPGIKEKILDSSALTINLDYVDIDEACTTMVNEGDEVAIIPPVSSG